MMKVPHARPDITKRDIDSVVAVLKTPYLARGPKMLEFEKRIARYVGVSHAVVVSSGTSALHLIVKALGIGRGDFVITTPLSFIASSNCILFEGATPVFVDIDPRTGMIDPDNVKTAVIKLQREKKRIKAILAVDLFGNLAPWQKLQRIAKKFNLFLIEDSAQALGTVMTIGGKRLMAGTFGDAGIFAFFPNKQITTGEGGAVVTRNALIAKKVQMLRNYGRMQGGYVHTMLGYNFHISDINCALGITQLERIEDMVAKRTRVIRRYSKHFSGNSDFSFYNADDGVRVSWFSAIVVLADRYTQKDRDAILRDLARAGVDCRNYYPPIHLQPFYRKEFGYKKGDFPYSESYAARTIGLPIFNNISMQQVDYVARTLLNVVQKRRRV